MFQLQNHGSVSYAIFKVKEELENNKYYEELRVIKEELCLVQ